MVGAMVRTVEGGGGRWRVVKGGGGWWIAVKGGRGDEGMVGVVGGANGRIGNPSEVVPPIIPVLSEVLELNFVETFNWLL